MNLTDIINNINNYKTMNNKLKKKITIINDAAWVGYEIAEGLRELNKDVLYLPRNFAGPNAKSNFIYSVYGKIFSPVINAIKATGIIHVNYALQDAFCVRLLGKKINVLHCHGTDLFGLLDEQFKKESKDLTRWKTIIEGNIKSARTVLVSTPEMLTLAKQIRRDAEYLPNPVDVKRFSPKTIEQKEVRAIGFDSWYEKVPKEVIDFLEKNNVKVDVYDRRPFSYLEFQKTLTKYQIYIDRIHTKGVSSFSKACLEAMSCGLVTIDFRHKENVIERATNILNYKNRKNEAKKNRKFILEKHDRLKVTEKLLEIYNRQE